MPATYNPKRISEILIPPIIEQNHPQVHVQNDIPGTDAQVDNVFEIQLPPIIQIEQNHPQMHFQNDIAGANAHVDGNDALQDDHEDQNDIADAELAANESALILNAMQPQNEIDNDVVPINEIIDVIIIENDDEDVEPADSKQNILPRVKVEESDLAAIEIILNGGVNERNVAPEAVIPQNQVVAAAQNQVTAAEIGMPGPSGIHEQPAQLAESSDSKEVVFMNSPPKPRQAKLEHDDFSGKIPHAKNVCSYYVSTICSQVL